MVMLSCLLLLLACASEPSAPPVEAPPPAPEPQPTPGIISGSPILDTPVILGGIDNAAVEAALDLKSIRTCNHAGRPGKVLIRFRLQKDGRVESVETRSSTLRHPPTEDCIHQRLQQTTFPSLKSGEFALITWTFAL